MNFSSVTAFQNHLIDFGLAGTDLGVYLNGKPLYRYMNGFRSLEQRLPIDRSTVYPMYSMTKPVTCSAALSVYEDGGFLMDDPVCNYLPEFERMRVANTDGSVADAKNPIVMRHLFTMTAGFSYDYHAPLFQRELSKNPRYTSRDFTRVLSQVPLLYEPGTRYLYSFAHDVLGAVLEVIEGKCLSQILRERVFQKLGITSACFRLSEEARSHLACTYALEPNTPAAKLLPIETSPIYASERFESGGGGLFMTLEDYARFANALCLGGKSPDTGKRILSSGIIKAMAENQLSEAQLKDFRSAPSKAGYGYGLGVRTLMSPAEAASAGVKGEFGWAGMAGTYLLIDPARALTIVYCHSSLPSGNDYVHRRIRNLVYSALEKE